MHVGNREWICAGAVAEIYEDMGGTVHWFGKPTKGAFDACIDLTFDTNAKPKTLVIGDSLLTDIMGAGLAGHDSLLITSGIHRKSFKDLSHEVHWPAIKGLPSDTVKPTAVMQHLR